MMRDFLNMFSVFMGVIAFCLVVVFAIGLLKVEFGEGRIESASLNNNSASISKTTKNNIKNTNLIQNINHLDTSEEYPPKLE